MGVCYGGIGCDNAEVFLSDKPKRQFGGTLLSSLWWKAELLMPVCAISHPSFRAITCMSNGLTDGSLKHCTSTFAIKQRFHFGGSHVLHLAAMLHVCSSIKMYGDV